MLSARAPAHTQKLTKYITEQEVDNAFRSEEALTVSLMGLIAEDSLISQRLAKLGPKKTSRPTVVPSPQEQSNKQPEIVQSN
jgi:hypothetical protein